MSLIVGRCRSWSAVSLAAGLGLLITGAAGPQHLVLKIDGSRRFQTIDGFGVNANTASWDGDSLKPAIDSLVDTLHATLWRVVIEEMDWEATNDDADPLHFNWDYYDKVYSAPRFERAWSLISYLNQRGITRGVIVNFMGRLPQWMGRERVAPGQEDEFVETVVSLLYYARHTRHLEFGYVAPMNEPDIRNEGPSVGAAQYATILRKLVARLDAVGLGDLEVVAPDTAGVDKGIRDYLPRLLADPAVMAKVTRLGFHSYSGESQGVFEAIRRSRYPDRPFWMTEWNKWCDTCDRGQPGTYDYGYASVAARYLLQHLQQGASAGLVWEGYDSLYQHPPSAWSYWGMLEIEKGAPPSYRPRKSYYTFSQIARHLRPGQVRLLTTSLGSGLTAVAFREDASGRVVVSGEHAGAEPAVLDLELANLPPLARLELSHTSEKEDLRQDPEQSIVGNRVRVTIPARSVFAMEAAPDRDRLQAGRRGPEPEDWFAGDIHVHRSCGGEPIAYSRLREMMSANDLAVISVLADMGDGEVKDPALDLPRVNGRDDPASTGGRIVHWDAEWHFDPAGVSFEHKVIGGHLVALGLQNARTLLSESTQPVLEWAKRQHAVAGFVHMQYLDDDIPRELNCCLPLEYPVETALGTSDFVAEDVDGKDSAIHAYYRLLNCGFRPGLAAGTDYPCNEGAPLGSLLTYVHVPGGPLAYRSWIEGIARGRTVVSRNAHREFLDLVAGEGARPGDEVRLQAGGPVHVRLRWTATESLRGRLELVKDGEVVASREGGAEPGSPLVWEVDVTFPESGWLCARRMDEGGHQAHTGAVYVLVNDAPVRTHPEDAAFFVRWIDNLLEKTAPGGPWRQYFTKELEPARARYQKARAVFEAIATRLQP
ncbi:MAG TPA: CehA/McbA family metallohydrolase [Vicinamibacteria bacterium]|nr:CehA/McbA family metallohydrolase [Vicinamibacteria bacterium]